MPKWIEGPPKKPKNVFIDVLSTKVVEIDYDFAGTAITAVKDKSTDDWTVSTIEDGREVTYAGDDNAILTLIEDISMVTYQTLQQYIIKPNDPNMPPPEELGLNNPYGTIELKLQDGSSRSLVIGNRLASDTSCYAQRNNDKNIYIIPSFNMNTLAVTFFQLRDKLIVNRPLDDLVKIDFAWNNQFYIGQKDPKSRTWVFSEPVEVDVPAVELSTIFNRLANLEIGSLHPDVSPDEAMLADNTKGLFILTFKDGTEMEIVIGKPVDTTHYYCIFPATGEVASVPKYFIDSDIIDELDTKLRNFAGLNTMENINTNQLQGGDYIEF